MSKRDKLSLTEEEALIPTLEASEKALIERALHATKFNVTRTAALLGVAKATFYRRIGRFAIKLEEHDTRRARQRFIPNRDKR